MDAFDSGSRPPLAQATEAYSLLASNCAVAPNCGEFRERRKSALDSIIRLYIRLYIGLCIRPYISRYTRPYIRTFDSNMGPTCIRLYIRMYIRV